MIDVSVKFDCFVIYSASYNEETLETEITALP